MVIRLKKMYKKLYKKIGTALLGILTLFLVIVCIKMPDYTDEVNQYKIDPKVALYAWTPFKQEVNRQLQAIVDYVMADRLNQNESTYEVEFKYVMFVRRSVSDDGAGVKRLYSNIDKYKEATRRVYYKEEDLKEIYDDMQKNYHYVGWFQNAYAINYLYMGLPEELEKGGIFYNIEQALKKEMWIKEKIPSCIYVLTVFMLLLLGYSIRRHFLVFLMFYSIIGSGSLVAVLGPLQLTQTEQMYRLKGILIVFMLIGCIGAFVWMYEYGKSLGQIKKYIVGMARDNEVYESELKIEGQALADMVAALNEIPKGLKLITEEVVKSERAKAELITNVSHDLKTPLTGMINYIGLLKRIDFDHPDIRRHIVALENKTQALKQRIDEVIEASKALTNNVQTQVQPLEVDELVSQIIGEYSEKLEEANLELYVQKVKGMRIMADSIVLWRIIEILFDNIIEYAMPGSRVYLEIRENQIIFKNMSRLPLKQYPQIDGIHFMMCEAEQPYIGIGLTIAERLTALQQGKFQIERDGDLFKVSLSFPN